MPHTNTTAHAAKPGHPRVSTPPAIADNAQLTSVEAAYAPPNTTPRRAASTDRERHMR